MSPSASEFLQGLVDPERVHTAMHTPVLRGPYYWDVPVPDSWRRQEAVTVAEVESAQEVAAILRKANQQRLPVYVRHLTNHRTVCYLSSRRN